MDCLKRISLFFSVSKIKIVYDISDFVHIILFMINFPESNMPNYCDIEFRKKIMFAKEKLYRSKLLYLNRKFLKLEVFHQSSFWINDIKTLKGLDSFFIKHR